MKKHFLYPLIFCAVALLSACSKKTDDDPQPLFNPSKSARLSGFTWSNLTTPGTWQSSYFVDQNTGFLAGNGGAIVRTTNGGLSFQPVTSPTVQDLPTCYFLNANVGFVAGNNNAAFRTTNGGTSWTALNLPALPLPTVHFRCIYFLDALTGFLGGGGGTLLKTTDGGITWTNSNSGIASNFTTYSVFFYDNNIGLASGGGGRVYRTTNGGASWTVNNVHHNRAVMLKIDNIHYTSYDSTFVTSSIGIPAGSDRTTYFASLDKGLTWNPKILPGPYQGLTGVKALGPEVIYLVGGNYAANTGVLYSSTTSGMTWKQEAIPPSSRFTSISGYRYSSTDGVIFAVGLNNTVIKGQ